MRRHLYVKTLNLDRIKPIKLKHQPGPIFMNQSKPTIPKGRYLPIRSQYPSHVVPQTVADSIQDLYAPLFG
jgi:hypothetical protein